jgi:hypothetical protein
MWRYGLYSDSVTANKKITKEKIGLQHSKRLGAVAHSFGERSALFFFDFVRFFHLFSLFRPSLSFLLISLAPYLHRQLHAVISSHPTLYSDRPTQRYGPYNVANKQNGPILNLSPPFPGLAFCL